MTSIDQYDYHLPSELIAQQPLEKRTDARLLVVNRQTQEIQHQYIRDLPVILRSSDCLVLNNTKVVPARLVGRRTSTGGRWQGLFLEADATGNWLVLAKTRGKIQPGERVTLENREAREDIQLELLANLGAGQWAVKPLVDEPVFDVLERVGRVPLPHYIRGGEAMPEDQQQYQTVFAQSAGAVAAPTAGLHFSDELLARIDDAGIRREFVTLHVGPGTFRPVKVEKIEEHVMDAERYEIPEPTAAAVAATKAAGRRVVAVGSTSVRTLETCADAGGVVKAGKGRSSIFIHPPYRFKAVDAMLTNFHLPRSTLLMMICALAGKELVFRAYAEAIREKYRFYSYGDCMLIL